MGQVQGQGLQFFDEGEMCYNIPLYMTHCGAEEMPYSPDRREHTCLLQLPAKIASSFDFYIISFSENEMQKITIPATVVVTIAISVQIITLMNFFFCISFSPSPYSLKSRGWGSHCTSPFSVHSVHYGSLSTPFTQTDVTHQECLRVRGSVLWFVEWTQQMMIGPQAGRRWPRTHSLRDATTSFISAHDTATY